MTFLSPPPPVSRIVPRAGSSPGSAAPSLRALLASRNSFRPRGEVAMERQSGLRRAKPLKREGAGEAGEKAAV